MFPEPLQHEPSKHFLQRLHKWKKFRTIAEVENVTHIKGYDLWSILGKGDGVVKTYTELHLNQIVFIEPTETGKCKIVKI